MGDPYVREVGRVVDLDGRHVPVGVDYDSAVILGYRIGREQIGDLGRLIVTAAWEAGENARRMAEETPSTPVSGSSRKIGREWCRVKPGVQARLLSFGGVNDDAFAWIDVREHGDG